MKKLISLILAVAALTAFAACSPAEPQKTTPNAVQNSTPEETPTETPEPPVTEPSGPVVIAEGGQAKLYIVMPRGKSLDTVYAKDKLYYFVKSSLDLKLEFGQDSADYEYELLLGNTGREESTAFTESLPDGKYGIKLEGKKIIIASKELVFLYDAVEYMIENFITVSEAGMVIDMPTSTYIGDGDPTSLRYVLTKAEDKKIQFKRDNSFGIDTAPPAEQIYASQGGCTDGENFYQAFIQPVHADPNKKDERYNNVIIVKQDKDGNVIKTSEMFSGDISLNHANDMTYNSKTHEIYVAHAKPNNKKVSVLDADTLELKTTLNVITDIYAISYSPERDVVVAAMSNGYDLRAFTPTFNKYASGTIEGASVAEGCTPQGICSDDTFIYSLLITTGKKNVITVYDWHGNFICLIDTGIFVVSSTNMNEGENLRIYDGQLLLTAYYSSGVGAKTYKIIPKN